MIKAIFFDVDDTIYDHLQPFKLAVQNYTVDIQDFPYESAYHRMRFYSDSLSKQLGGASKMESNNVTEKMQAERFLLTLKEYQISISYSQAQEIQNLYYTHQFNISPFPGIESLIKELQAKNLIVGLLTNGAYEHQWKKIRALYLNEWIPENAIFVSGQFGWDKPDVRIFQHIHQAFSLRPNECVYIGDSWRNDVVGAVNAGWNMIWFNHRNQKCDTSHYNHVKEARSPAEINAKLQEFLKV